jgi:peptidoglycan/LPS O-acetylase OafA/YrhL
VDNARRIDALTGLRPFASLYVFFFHFGRPLLASAPAWLRSLGGGGFVGVSFFYVLSGFVLAHSYGARMTSGAFDHRRFLARRLARLAPAYFAALLLLLLLPLALRHDGNVGTSALGGVLQLFMLQAWWPPAALTWNLPAWSISVEVAFYLVLPSLIRAIARLSLRRRALLLVVTWAVALVIAGVYSALLPDGAVGPDSNVCWLDFVKFWPPARLPEFAFGVTLGLSFARAPAAPRWLGAVALAVAAALLGVADRLPFALVHNALLLPCFGAIVWSAAGARGAVGRVLASRPLYRLGRASYDIYILQMPLMYLVLAAKVPLGGGRFFVFFGLLVYGVGLAFHLTVEQRVQRWLDGAYGKSSTKSATRRASATRARASWASRATSRESME